MHPTEKMVGEVAGHPAAFCDRRQADPTEVRNTPELLAAFQEELEPAGIPTRWRNIIE
jgi:hypothetical protein